MQSGSLAATRIGHGLPQELSNLAGFERPSVQK